MGDYRLRTPLLPYEADAEHNESGKKDQISNCL